MFKKVIAVVVLAAVASIVSASSASASVLWSDLTIGNSSGSLGGDSSDHGGSGIILWEEPEEAFVGDIVAEI